MSIKNTKIIDSSGTKSNQHFDLDLGIDTDDGTKYLNESVLTAKNTHLYINGEIEKEAPWFYKALHLLNTAGQNDYITIHLNTPGGDVVIAAQLLNAINMCKAKITLILEGQCCSAGTMLAFGGSYDNIVVSEYTLFLFHTGSTLVGGRLDIAKESLLGMEEWVKNIMRNCYKDILTKEEIKRLEDGAEIYMLASDVISRLKQRSRLIELENKKLEERNKKVKTKKKSVNKTEK